MLNTNKKWILYVEDKTNEYGVKEIANMVTSEVPVVGNFVKFCKIGTYEIIEVVNVSSTAPINIEDIELQDGLPYIVDTGDNNGRAIYGVGVRLTEGE